MFTTRFWKRATERAVKSAAHGAILALGSAATLDALSVDYRLVGGFALGGALLSYLTSLGSEPFGPGDDPSTI